MSQDKGESQPVAEGSDKALDEAKKGQPRNFLLVTKGTSVKYLQVSKKPIKPGAVSAAAKLGFRGDTAIGVVVGRGGELVFELAISEGHTREPVKDMELKSFLDEEADFKCRPTIKLVAEPTPVPFDENDKKNPVVARFLALEAEISAVLDAKPELADEMRKHVNAIRLLLQDELFTDATKALDEFETWLRSQGGASVTAGQESPPNDKRSSTDMDALKSALAALKPEVEALVQASPGDAGPFKSGLQEVAKLAAAGSLTEGLALCDQLTNQMREKWTRDARGWLQRLVAVLAQPFEQQSAEVGKLRAVQAFVLERANGKRFGSALAALLKVAPLIEAAEKGTAPREAAVIPQGIVAQRVAQFAEAKVRWDEGVRRASAEIGKIQAGIRGEDPELSAAIADVLDGYRRELGDVLQGALKVRDEPGAEKIRQELIEHTRRLLDEFQKDELIAHLDTFARSPVKLRDTLVSALKQVDERLTVAVA